MRRTWRFSLWVLTIVCCFRMLFLPCAASLSHTAVYDTILQAQLTSAGAEDVQTWITDTLAARAGSGSPEWYVMALAQSGKTYDMTAYTAALHTVMDNQTGNAVQRQRCALAMLAAAPDCNAAAMERLLAETLGKQGIMSEIFGLHLMQLDVPSPHSKESVVQMLCARQLADGGWALSGNIGDVDVTAMTIQALAPHRKIQAVEDAIAKGLSFLSAKQLDDGSYVSYGVSNPESGAQVWIALAALGIDSQTDPRFCKNGNTIADAILRFQCESGGFAHVANGKENANATVQVFLALTAQRLLETEQRSLYAFLRNDSPAASTSAASSTAAQTSTSATTHTTNSAAATAGLQHDSTSQSIPNGSSSTWIGSHTSAVDITAAEQLAPNHTAGSGNSTVRKMPLLRWLLTAAILLTAALICVVMWRKGRRHPNHILLVLGCGAVMIAGVWWIRLETPEQYYGTQPEKSNVIGTVTYSIRCDQLPNNHTHAHLPEDGILLPPTVLALGEGETILDLLYEVTKTQKLQLEVNGLQDEQAYIRSIANLYEFDYGDLSGWMYRVNGESPSIGCGQYVLSDGDVVEWIYSLSMGEDLFDSEQ